MFLTWEKVCILTEWAHRKGKVCDTGDIGENHKNNFWGKQETLELSLQLDLYTSV